MNDEEQNENLSVGALDAYDGVVEAAPDKNARDDLVWDLDDDVGDDKGLPRVCLAWPFSDFVERPLSDEVWDNLTQQVSIRLFKESSLSAYLLHERGKNGSQQEDGEDDILHSRLRSRRLEERETDE